MWSQEHNSSLLLGLFQHSSMSSSILVFLLSCIYSLGNCLGYWRYFLVLSWAEPNMGTLLWSEDAFSSFWYWRLFRLFVEYSSWYLSSCKRQYSVLICCPIPLLGTREHSGTYHDPDILIWQTIFQLTWTYQDILFGLRKLLFSASTLETELPWSYSPIVWDQVALLVNYSGFETYSIFMWIFSVLNEIGYKFMAAVGLSWIFGA